MGTRGAEKNYFSQAVCLVFRSTEGGRYRPQTCAIISSSVAHKKRNSNGYPPFLGSRIPTVLLPMMSHATGSRKSKMGAVLTDAAITFERLEISTRFQLLHHIFDQVRHKHDTAAYRIQNGGHGNRKWKSLLTAMNWRHDSNGYPNICDQAGHAPNTPDIARR